MPYLADLLASGAASLTCNLREVIPNLLQEWGRNDSAQCLDDLLVLTGLLRCAAAEAAIVLIVTQRIGDGPEEIALRKRCLGVLSGFGCSVHSAPLFYGYVYDINYSALCFRAVYKYKLNDAIRMLPKIVAVHKAAEKLEALKGVLNLFFFEHFNEPQRLDAWRKIIALTEPKELEEMLLTLQAVNIVLSIPKTADAEIEVIYDYSVNEPAKPGEKVRIYELKDAAFDAVMRALEAFLLSSNGIAQAVGAGR